MWMQNMSSVDTYTHLIHLHRHQTQQSRDLSLFVVSLFALWKIWYNTFTGIALSNGYLWRKQKKFASTHLRYFGEGQKSLEKYIEVESNFLCEAFTEEQGK